MHRLKCDQQASQQKGALLDKDSCCKTCEHFILASGADTAPTALLCVQIVKDSIMWPRENIAHQSAVGSII